MQASRILPDLQSSLVCEDIRQEANGNFILVGVMVLIYGDFFVYYFLVESIQILGTTIALNRFVAFLLSLAIGLILYLWLNRTRAGMAVRAVSVSTQAAELSGINVPRISALAFAIGGAVTAVGGSLISTFITLDASIGVIFTMKALIIVIMGGVGDIRGAILAAVILGVIETAVATLIDPGLTLVAAYLIFVVILLFRPQGLFGVRET